jgi:hypothetical protein
MGKLSNLTQTKNKPRAEASPQKREKTMPVSNSGSGNTAEGTFLETFITLVVIENSTVLVRGILNGGSNALYIHSNVLKSVGV